MRRAGGEGGGRLRTQALQQPRAAWRDQCSLCRPFRSPRPCPPSCPRGRPHPCPGLSWPSGAGGPSCLHHPDFSQRCQASHSHSLPPHDGPQAHEPSSQRPGALAGGEATRAGGDRRLPPCCGIPAGSAPGPVLWGSWSTGNGPELAQSPESCEPPRSPPATLRPGVSPQLPSLQPATCPPGVVDAVTQRPQAGLPRTVPGPSIRARHPASSSEGPAAPPGPLVAAPGSRRPLVLQPSEAMGMNRCPDVGDGQAPTLPTRSRRRTLGSQQKVTFARSKEETRVIGSETAR